MSWEDTLNDRDIDWGEFTKCDQTFDLTVKCVVLLVFPFYDFSVSHVTHPFSVTERPTLQLQGKFPFMSMKTEGCGDVDGRTNVLVNFFSTI